MARRRMICNAITDSYSFQSMDAKTQLLYVYLCLKADDDGFVGNPYMYTMLTGCGENDLAILEERGYIIRFDSGVAAVVHWHIHNTIKKDRYNPTVHTKELAQLRLEDKCYVRILPPEPERNQNGTKMEPQYSPVKSSPVKSSPVESSQGESNPAESNQGESNQGESNQAETNQGKNGQDDVNPNEKKQDRTVKRSLFPLFCYDSLFSLNEISDCEESETAQTTAKPQVNKHAARKGAPERRKKQRPKNKGEPSSPLSVC